MMTERTAHMPTLTERQAMPINGEPGLTTEDIVVRGENAYSEPDRTTSDVVVLGENIHSDYSQESLERAIEHETNSFKSWINLKVKDYLMVAIAKNGENAPININEVSHLVGSLVKEESGVRLAEALRIDTFEIPDAKLRQDAGGVATNFTIHDIPMLEWQSLKQKNLANTLSELLNRSQEETYEMVEELIQNQLDAAKFEVRAIPSAKELEWVDGQAEVEVKRQAQNQTVTELTELARDLAK